MTKQEIIAELGKNKVVETLIKKTTKHSEEELKDLGQDIYMNLLEKEEEKVVKMYENNELEYYIIGMITKNFFSQTSPYYTKYKRWKNNKEQLIYEDGEERFNGEYKGNTSDI